MKDINAKLGAVSSAYGMYSHLDSDQYDGYELFEEFDDVVRSGAVFIPSVMPVLAAGFAGITPSVAHQVAGVMKNFTDRGVRVWLRFGHEMNWYTDPVSIVPNPTWCHARIFNCKIPGTQEASPRYYGTPVEFVTAWENVAKAVANNPLVLMFWSPNNIGNGSAEVLDEWYPGDGSVDLVGIDCYPQSTEQTFEYLYKNFYDRFAAGKNKPFAIGETGTNAKFKEWWLTELVTQRRAEYPNFISMSWFEYLKGDDFRLVEAGNDVLAKTRKILGLDHYHW